MTARIWSVLNHDQGWNRPTQYSNFTGIQKHPLLKLSAGFYADRTGYLISKQTEKISDNKRYFFHWKPAAGNNTSVARCDYHFGKTRVIKTSKRFLADRCTTLQVSILGILLPQSIKRRCEMVRKRSRTTFSGCCFDSTDMERKDERK